jgi:hypothetical protein
LPTTGEDFDVALGATALEVAINKYRKSVKSRLSITAEDEKEHITLLKKTCEEEKKVRCKSMLLPGESEC